MTVMPVIFPPETTGTACVPAPGPLKSTDKYPEPPLLIVTPVTTPLELTVAVPVAASAAAAADGHREWAGIPCSAVGDIDSSNRPHGRENRSRGTRTAAGCEAHRRRYRISATLVGHGRARDHDVISRSDVMKIGGGQRVKSGNRIVAGRRAAAVECSLTVEHACLVGDGHKARPG